MSKKIDCLGDFCPLPLLKAEQEYKKIKNGEEFTLITDLSCATSNIRSAFRDEKCIIEDEEEMPGIWKITIKKL